MDKYQAQYIKDRALDCKSHLEKYPSSVSTIYTDKNELDENKIIFLEILGASLIKRVTFIPNH